MKALVVNLCDLGDVLFSTPLLEALAGDHEVHTLTDATCAAAVKGHPCVAQRWVLPRSDWTLALSDPVQRPAALAQALSWAEALREQRFDTVYCLQSQLLAVTLAGIAGGRSARGFVLKDGAVSAGEGSDVLMRHLLSFENRADDGLHAAEAFLSLLPQGRWPARARLSFAVSEEAERRVAELCPGSPGRRVAVLPGAGGAHKRWALTEWIAFLRAWRRIFPKDRLMVVGGPDDVERGRLLARRLPGVEDLCGRLRLEESAALFKGCAAVVGGDTGPLHLAAAVGAPCLGLFAETHPSESGPLLEGSLSLKASSGSMDDLEAGPVVRGLVALLEGQEPLGLKGLQTWASREAEGERIAAAWAAASSPAWLARQRGVEGALPVKELAEELMERARLGLERLEGPALAWVHSYLSLTFRIFREERP